VKPWDIAAGVLLVREAGGRVTDFRGAGTGPLDHRGVLGRQIVAGGLKLSESLQKGIVNSGYAKAF
jgi:myo-inositol-1(or 4)-monophosphatase